MTARDTVSETRLRQVLWADAALCLGFGLACAAGMSLLTGLLGLPEWLIWSGVAVLFAAATLMAVAASRHPLNRPLVALVVAGNLGWIAASLALALSGVAASALGTGFLVVQALAVVPLAWLEWQGLRGASARLSA
ncbi:MAG: hypothetical protein ACU0DK_06085 [Pseudooceanicola sp.]